MENTDVTALQGIIVGLELEMQKQARVVTALSERDDVKTLSDRCLELSERVLRLEKILTSYGFTGPLEE